MTDLTENDVKKALEFCGGIEGFNDLMKSQETYLLSDICDSSDSLDYLTNVTINDKRVVIINKVIPTNHPSEYDYIDVSISEKRYTLYLSRENLIKLLNDVAAIDNNYEEVLITCRETPCYLTVTNGLVEKIELIDRTKYDYAQLLWDLSYIVWHDGKFVINKLAVKE